TAQDQWLGRWPLAREEAVRSWGLRVLRPCDRLRRLEGAEQKVLVEILVSTEHLTVGKLTLLAGQASDVLVRGGDSALYVEEGCLHVFLPGREGPSFFELKPRDGFYLPEGVAHRFFNYSDQPARVLFGVAPAYLK